MSKRFIGLFAGLIWSSGALAQVPVIDTANLTQAQQTASNTQPILTTDQSILTNVQKTLQAVTGNRSSVAQGSLAQMALGGGFSMGQAPFARFRHLRRTAFLRRTRGQFAKHHLDADQRVPTRQKPERPNDGLARRHRLYELREHDAAHRRPDQLDAGDGASASNSYTTGAQQIGSSPDVKGSIDQNSQIQAQNGQSIVQLNGTVNTAAAAANQANLDRIAQLSAAARAMQFKPFGQ